MIILYVCFTVDAHSCKHCNERYLSVKLGDLRVKNITLSRNTLLHHATDHFKGAILISERTPWLWQL